MRTCQLFHSLAPRSTSKDISYNQWKSQAAFQQRSNTSPDFPASWSSQKTCRPIPNIKFRVLIIGRANAGKTTILQRVCKTTDPPEIYRINKTTRERVRAPT